MKFFLLLNLAASLTAVKGCGNWEIVNPHNRGKLKFNVWCNGRSLLGGSFNSFRGKVSGFCAEGDLFSSLQHATIDCEIESKSFDSGDSSVDDYIVGNRLKSKDFPLITVRSKGKENLRKGGGDKEQRQATLNMLGWNEDVMMKVKKISAKQNEKINFTGGAVVVGSAEWCQDFKVVYDFNIDILKA